MDREVFDQRFWEPLKRNEFQQVINHAAQYLDYTKAADAVHVAGLALVRAGRVELGIKWLQSSVVLMKASPDWFGNAGNALADSKRPVEAEAFLNEGLALYPYDKRLRYIKAVVLSAQSRHEEALGILMVLDGEHPDDPNVWLTTGYCLFMLGRLEEALAAYQHVTPPNAIMREELDNNKYGVMLDQGLQQQAYDFLNERYPNSCAPKTIYNRSLAELGLGMWPKAWHDHIHRPITMPEQVRRPHKLLDIVGKDVFLFSEQGFGDCIQFVRFAPILHKHCARLTIGVPPALLRLFGCLPDDRPYDLLPVGGTAHRFDYALPMMDAPRLLDLTVDAIPAEVPYFKLPAALEPRWKREIMRIPHIGVVWAGGARPEDARAMCLDRRRSIQYEVFAELFHRLPFAANFVSLMLLNDLEKFSKPLLHHPLDATCDMLDTAKIVEQLDLVITIDSSVAHLAGALGKPVWMLSRFDGCWRWFWDGRTTSPWYPTMRIFHQPEHNTWPQVIAQVRQELQTTFG